MEAGILADYATRWLQNHGGPKAFDRLEFSVLVNDYELTTRPDLAVDPWGRPWRLVKHAYPTFALISHGADGESGGAGADADVVRYFSPRIGTVSDSGYQSVH